jgi:hypothetical protein
MFKQILAIAALGSVVLSAAPACDRACMTALVDQYLAAVVKHDPSGLPLSPGVRFTENTAEIKIGDGLWVSASEAPTTFKIYAVDPATSQVAFYGVMKELDKPLIIALRLKVIHGHITEIEHVLARNMRPDRMQNLITARPAFSPMFRIPIKPRAKKCSTRRTLTSRPSSTVREASRRSQTTASGTRMAARPLITRLPFPGLWISDRPRRPAPWPSSGH